MVRSDLIPSAAHYDAEYLGPKYERLVSYRQQLLYAQLEPVPKAVLIVGKGDDFVGSVLRHQGSDVYSLDIAPDLAPNIVGSVDAIPFKENSFDIVMCCQVLEHLPFEQVRAAFDDLCRVSRRRVIVSLPDVRRFCSFRAQLFRFSMNFQASLPRLRPKEIPEQRLKNHGHYWEVGFAGYSYGKILKSFENSEWILSEVMRVNDLAWHLFLVFDKKGS